MQGQSSGMDGSIAELEVELVRQGYVGVVRGVGLPCDQGAVRGGESGPDQSWRSEPLATFVLIPFLSRSFSFFRSLGVLTCCSRSPCSFVSLWDPTSPRLYMGFVFVNANVYQPHPNDSPLQHNRLQDLVSPRASLSFSFNVKLSRLERCVFHV